MNPNKIAIRVIIPFIRKHNYHIVDIDIKYTGFY